MIKHGKKFLLMVGAIGALAFGGAALANAGSTPVKPAVQPAAEPAGPDRDSIQSGDQTTPDTAGSAEQPGAEQPGAEQPETSGESPGSEVPNDDGPGGHADEPGNANADHQFNGQE
jgi:hypothetical protein